MNFYPRYKKEQRITPIVTIVFYTGEKVWDGPRSLYDMFEIPEELKQFVPDYSIHVIDMGHDDIKFQTKELWELTCVLRAIYNSSIGQNNEKVSNSMLSLAGILSKTEELYAIKEEGETAMCEAMREILEEAEQRGIEKLILNSLKKGHTCEAISDFNDIPLEEVKAVEKKFLTMQE